MLENCQKYSLNLFWNAYTWHELEDPIFYGQWTNLHDRSQNGPKHVTNDYLFWSLTFIIHVNANNIVMWETLPNNADWDGFKTPILQGDLEDSKSTSGGTLCVFGSHTFVPISWMCKKQTFSVAQFDRIRNHLFGRWIEIGRYTRTWFTVSDRRSSSRKHISEKSRTVRLPHEPSCSTSQTSNTKEISWNDWSGQCWFSLLKRQLFSSRSFVVCAWRQRSSDQDYYKGKKSYHETCFQNPQSCPWLGLTEAIWTPRSKSNTLTPRTNSQTHWQREISHVMNGIIFCVCSTLVMWVLPNVLKWCRKEHQKM